MLEFPVSIKLTSIPCHLDDTTKLIQSLVQLHEDPVDQKVHMGSKSAGRSLYKPIRLTSSVSWSQLGGGKSIGGRLRVI